MSTTKLDKHLTELEVDILKLKKDFFSIIKKFNLVKKEFIKINGNGNDLKKNKKKERKNKDDNNFNEPILYNFSKEICDILELEHNKELLFSDFNKKINQYLINNNLLINKKINIDTINNKFIEIFSKDIREKKINTITLKNIHTYLKHNYSIKN